MVRPPDALTALSRRFTSPLRSPRLTAHLGLWLAGAFAVCFATGLLSHAIQLAIDCGHLRDGDTGQYAFELYAFPLAVHHEAGLFGFDLARRHGEAAVERWFAAHAP